MKSRKDSIDYMYALALRLNEIIAEMDNRAKTLYPEAYKNERDDGI